MANTLEYSKIFQPLLDQQVTQESTTGWMEANDKFIKYEGGDEVKIATMLTDGLANYDRSNGFTTGSVDLKWNPYKLTQDRGRSFTLDSMDVDQTNFVATASTVMSEFQKQQVIPEIDAYRYSKIASLAIEGSHSREIALTADNIVSELLKDLTDLEEVGVTDVVITMSPTTASLLASAKNAKDYMSTTQLAKGNMNVRVVSFNENAIVRARQGLLQTAFKFNDGKTSGQEKGGFEKDSSSKAINWIISAKDAVVAVSKTDKVRVFDPAVNQAADAWKTDYRKFHDLWIPKAKLAKVFVNVKPS